MIALANTEASADIVERTEEGHSSLSPLAIALAHMTREERERVEQMLAALEIRRERRTA